MTPILTAFLKVWNQSWKRHGTLTLYHFDLSTKTAKGIWLFARKDRKIEVTQRGIVQEGYSEDDLPWDMVNYKRVFKPNVDIEKFM